PGVAENFPPLCAQHVIGRLGNLPHRRGFEDLRRRFLEGRRHRCGRPIVIGTDHAARQQQRADDAKPAEYYLLVAAACGALVRTGVPLIRESDGLTMTSSVGFRPETISTESP